MTNAVEPLAVHFVSPKVAEAAWKSAEAAALPGTNAQRRLAERWAHSSVALLHNRHVGLTPHLAVELGTYLSAARSVAPGPGHWNLVFLRLQGAILPKAGSLPAPRHLAILPAAQPVHILLRVVLPLLAAACQELKASYVFCENEVETDVEAEAYFTYAGRMGATLRDLATESSDVGSRMGQFWETEALSLASLSQTSVVARRERRRNPGAVGPNPGSPTYVDPAAVAYLLRLAPEMRRKSSPPVRQSRLQPPPKLKVLSRRREGGIDGIHLTRREEDLDNLLISEFFNPTPILAERLLHTGFLATRREPRQQPPRDLLWVGLMPGGDGTLARDFVKACWYDTVVRLAGRLIRRGRLKSEFCWLEGDALQRYRVCRFSLETLPPALVNQADFNTPLARRLFLTALQWLPGYLDVRAAFAPLTGAGDMEPEAGDWLDWSRRAWRAAQASLGCQHKLAAYSGAFLDRYAVVHTTLFAPAQAQAVGQSTESGITLGQIHAQMGLGIGSGRHVSVTWVPRRIQGPSEPDDQQWGFEARQRLPLWLPGGLTEAQIAGRLVEAWLSQLERELGYG